jgi:aflatoxin B1 aldehyde reductase
MTFGGQVDEAGGLDMLESFAAAGNGELDTAYVYCDGKTEAMLGRLITPKERTSWYIATKAYPTGEQGLKAASVHHQLVTSLDRLNTDHADLFYLHAPDLSTPVAQTLEACWQLFEAGKFREFGLSNYAAWQVAEITHICDKNGWMQPSVYQGMYNPLTRDVERELFPCLRNFGIRFYAYNPLAGGMLTGKHRDVGGEYGGGRFDRFENYRDRYWNRKYFDAIGVIVETCAHSGIAPAEAALRWLVHHSRLSAEAGDAVIIGASTISHLEHNVAALQAEPLPAEVVAAFEQGWESTRPACMKYFRP